MEILPKQVLAQWCRILSLKLEWGHSPSNWASISQGKNLLVLLKIYWKNICCNSSEFNLSFSLSGSVNLKWIYLPYTFVLTSIVVLQQIVCYYVRWHLCGLPRCKAYLSVSKFVVLLLLVLLVCVLYYSLSGCLDCYWYLHVLYEGWYELLYFSFQGVSAVFVPMS